MTVLPLGEVKSHLSEIVGRVHDYHERVTVTVHGRPSAILIAPEDLEAVEEAHGRQVQRPTRHLPGDLPH